jgi:adenylyl-sulfate kinase|tara:strand:+ start:26 stop:544 length:519 start_codon:yes stop_codon:yes gene_type:complete
MVIWFTGMSGSGKSTLSNELIKHLTGIGKKVLLLDGDEIRSKVDCTFDFSVQSIKENNFKIIDFCKENINLYDFIIVSIIAPFEETRKYARHIIGDNYKEIFIKASLNTLIKRDTKGLYEKARNGELNNLIGVDPNTPYQIPVDSDLIIDTDLETKNQSFKTLLSSVLERNM